MALDAATLELTARELKTVLADAKIAKLFEPTRDELVITLRTRTDTYALLLAARERRGQVVHPRMQPNPQEQLFRTGAAFRLTDALQYQREHYVFDGCQPRNQLKTLKHEPDFLTAHLRQFVRRQRRNVPPVQTIYPRSWTIKAAKDVHQRRFS